MEKIETRSFAERQWEHASSESVVEQVADGRLVGLVCAYNTNQRDDFAYLGGLCDVPFTRSGLCAESLMLLADRVFRNWNLRRVFFEAPVFNYERFASLGYFKAEARLQEHTYSDGRYWDLIVGSLTREGFGAIADLRRRRQQTAEQTRALLVWARSGTVTRTQFGVVAPAVASLSTAG